MDEFHDTKTDEFSQKFFLFRQKLLMDGSGFDSCEQTCPIAILECLNPAPYWRFFFQMLFRLFQSWKSQILAKHAWIANWQYLLVLDTIYKTVKKLSQPNLFLSK